jgi:hypothetical protein
MRSESHLKWNASLIEAKNATRGPLGEPGFLHRSPDRHLESEESPRSSEPDAVAPFLALTAPGADTLQTFPEPQKYSHPKFSLILSSAMCNFVYYDLTKQ